MAHEAESTVALKRVLIITYQFPPNPSVASVRPAGLVRYLPEFGWEPVVLTAKMPGRVATGLTVIETPYRDAFGSWRRRVGIDPHQNIMTQVNQLKRKLHIKSERSLLDRVVAVVGEIVAYPDPQKSWRSPAVRAGSDFLGREPVDAILSGSSPYTAHVVARTLKLRHQIRWVADLRDLWTQNHYYPYSRLRRLVERRLELKTLSEADALVTVSEPAKCKLAELHKGKAIHTITNGFDPGEVNDPPVKLTNTFTITYTGNLYPGRQSPEPLFAALKELLAAGGIQLSRLEVRFYGAEAGWIDAQAERYGLREIVRQYGVVPRSDALNRQRESQVLLLLKWNDPAERGTYTAKLFDYLAARRPILAVGGHGDVVSDLLQDTGAGVDAPTAPDVKTWIGQAYRAYQAGGSVPYTGDQGSISRHSHMEMARRFAEVLDNVSR